MSGYDTVGYSFAVSVLEKSLSGRLGEENRKMAERDLQHAREAFERSMTVDNDGAVRWNISGHYADLEMCERLVLAGCPVSIDATCDKRNLQLRGLL